MKTVWRNLQRARLESPLEVWLGIVFAFLGAIGLGSNAYTSPGTVEAMVSCPVLIAWAVALMVGGMCTTVGAVGRFLRTRSFGLSLLVVANLLYAGALIVEGPWPSALSTTLVMVAVAGGFADKMRALARSREAVQHARERRRRDG